VHVSLSRVRSLKDLVILDDHIPLCRFKSLNFYRGFKNQIREYKRLNIDKFAFGDNFDIRDLDEDVLRILDK
jgi:hypothetical protein